MLKAIVNSPVRSGDQTIVNGDLVVGTAGEGVNFNANTPAAGMTSQSLNWYEEGTATLTATGMTTSPTGTVYYTRNGRLVTLDLPTITGTSNATSFTLTGLPTPVTPTNAKRLVVQVNDNGGNVQYGMADIGTGGTITLYLTPQGALFTASGTKGIYFCSVAYSLA